MPNLTVSNCEFCQEAVSPEESIIPCQCPYVYHRPCINHVFDQITDPISMQRCSVCDVEYSKRYKTQWGKRVQSFFQWWSRNMIYVYATWVSVGCILAVSAGGVESFVYGLSLSNITYVLLVWSSILSVYFYWRLRGWWEPVIYTIISVVLMSIGITYHQTWANWTTIALAGGLLVRTKRPLFVVTADFAYVEVQNHISFG